MFGNFFWIWSLRIIGYIMSITKLSGQHNIQSSIDIIKYCALEEMVQSVRRLDYEMQHLVYENYNKFLTATTTVKKMQDEFTTMNEVFILDFNIP